MVDQGHASELHVQDAADVAADGAVEEAEAAAVGGALGTCDAEAAAEVADLPSSSTGGVPHLQQAVQKQKQKRTALPEHARMVIELQVRCATFVWLRRLPWHDALVALDRLAALHRIRLNLTPVGHETKAKR